MANNLLPYACRIGSSMAAPQAAPRPAPAHAPQQPESLIMLIAQISDLHIRMPGQKAYKVVETDKFLPPAIDTLNRLDPAPDLVIISGDLTDFGKPQEYAHLKSMLDALRLPYFLMPGNHDDRAAMADTFAQHAYLRAAQDYLQYAVEDYPL